MPAASTEAIVTATGPLGFMWETLDPFLFCVHHNDNYPRGNADMGPAASLAGRHIGSDFEGKDGWRMYHSDTVCTVQVPGFPRHPHRGFETVTLVRDGLIDHSDSLGATARFGGGDCQWMTAGTGIEHCEMFPLVNETARNPMELFQIWLNLPARSKHAAPHFAMLWAPQIPRHALSDAAGRGVTLTTVAGEYAGVAVGKPPPDSWASVADAEVAIWSIRLDAGAEWTIPAAGAGVNRRLYVFAGQGLTVGGTKVPGDRMVDVRPDVDVRLVNGDAESEVLMLQGRPIGEPVAKHGPFVMNTRAEIEAAFGDYRSGKFGRWPWVGDAPTHERERGRFAIHADGREELPPAE